MPFEKGEREFWLALIACGTLLSAGSAYAARGEVQLQHRSLVGNKILAASTITLVAGIALLVLAVLKLAKR
jgi:hypothetical protein